MAARCFLAVSNPSRLQRICTVPYALSAREFSNDVQKPGNSQGVMAALKTKTGVTGTLVLGVGVSAALLSKEIYVVNAESIVMVAVLGTMYQLVKKIGKPVAEWLDGRSQDLLDTMNTGKNARMSALEEQIAVEKNVEGVLSVRSDILDIIKERTDLLREEEYRRRLSEVKGQVKKRLDYQLQTELMEKQYQHKHLVAWLEETVRQSLQSKPDESIPRCIANLKTMSATA